MIKFNKLRLSGFKSFVDKTELDIDTGLTGIVGPNGCGKSNLVEALRWVMGENSAKKMRGAGGMEDVIFNGTSSRPARNMAEVALLLDNADRSAPPAYNAEDEIEVTRKIEKDRGSLYKINGKTSRARDVQMLFADTVTGANSPALVSQGRVTEMINAKPQQRRLILEESAGVSGLYVRRHEAELRLRAADANLQRLDDLVGGMEDRLGALKKQARQAVRYKELGTKIREAESTIAWLEWRLVNLRIQKARANFAQSESQVAEYMASVSQLTQTQNTQSQDLPDLRQEEAEAAAALQATRIKLEHMEAQERELENQLHNAKAQLAQTKEDQAHETEMLAENKALLEKLEAEEKDIAARQAQEHTQIEEKNAIQTQLKDSVNALENEHDSVMTKLAEMRAYRQSLAQQITADESRLLVAQEREGALQEDLKAAKEGFENDSNLDDLKTHITDFEKEITDLRAALESHENKLVDAQNALETARENQQRAAQKHADALTEINTIQSLLTSDTQDKFKPILDDITPEQGFETALSRALGDTLMASTDMDAPVVWESRVLENMNFPTFPDSIQKLSPHVKAPAPVKAALELIGVVNDESDGEKYAGALKIGQSIVSREGAYWRWDGLHIKSNAADKHALALQQRNRLSALETQIQTLARESEQAHERFNTAQDTLSTLRDTQQNTQNNLREKESELARMQAELSNTTEERSALFAKIATLEEGLRSCRADITEYTKSIAETQQKIEKAAEEDSQTQDDAVDRLREKLNAKREELREAVRMLDRLEQDKNRRKARSHAIADERLNVNNKVIRGGERLKDLSAREETLTNTIQDLENRPKTISTDRQEMMDSLETLEKTRDEAAHKLAAVEGELAQTSAALRAAEAQLSEAREARAGAQATASAGEEQMREITDSIAHQFSMTPEELSAELSLDINAEDEDALPDLEDIKTSRDKYTRSRDLIGAVNLRAETEALELEKEVGGMLSERSDLIEAIEELRGGIHTLNTEARGRLLAAFDHVNGHFQRLFKTLFAGGEAHLKLIESDDPLEAGLEIFAQPPGKTLQSLSLLSGGEQTLASIALIFAMFLTNPSPICVLDEIDAPLDDANVDRVCDLLDEIAERGETKFIVITHHRLTMARMDRLYGVTMAERGISKLVSVDLNQQMDFLDEAA